MANPFSDRKHKLDLLRALRPGGKKNLFSAGTATQYVTCKSCGADFDSQTLQASLNVCPRCGFHMYMPGKTRLQNLFDGGKYKEKFTDILPRDPLNFPGYIKKTAELSAKTELPDACVAAVGKIGGHSAVCAVIDISFMMGSMGTAVGEKITLSAELAAASKRPLIIFTAGGGARMQEGIFSLMQMIKTSAAIRRFSDNGGLFISYITHPTTGGITASFAGLGDITLAEPGALYGFAGPRVIEQTIGEKLPEGFQRSEFQLAHGFVDAVVPRGESRRVLLQLLSLHERRSS